MHPDLIPPTTAKALVFDCDGTLAITRHAHFASLQQAFAAQGFTLHEDWYLAHTGLSLNETCHAFAADFSVHCDVAAVRADHARLFPTLISLVRPVEWVCAVARFHHGKLPISVASGGDQHIVEMTLGQIGMRPVFDHVIAIGTITRGKPAPDLFLAAADRMATRPVDCFVYEDSDEGIEAANRAGMCAIDIRRIVGLPR